MTAPRSNSLDPSTTGVRLETPAISAISPPDGCSLGLPEVYQHGLDRALFYSCRRHDLCWRSGEGSCATGFPGLGLKMACDAVFYGELLAVCTATQVAMKAAGSSKEHVRRFGSQCQAAASAAFLGVSANVRGFMKTQCEERCNARMCRLMGDLQRAERCCPEPSCPLPRPIES